MTAIQMRLKSIVFHSKHLFGDCPSIDSSDKSFACVLPVRQGGTSKTGLNNEKKNSLYHFLFLSAFFVEKNDHRSLFKFRETCSMNCVQMYNTSFKSDDAGVPLSDDERGQFIERVVHCFKPCLLAIVNNYTAFLKSAMRPVQPVCQIVKGFSQGDFVLCFSTKQGRLMVCAFLLFIEGNITDCKSVGLDHFRALEFLYEPLFEDSAAGFMTAPVVARIALLLCIARFAEAPNPRGHDRALIALGKALFVSWAHVVFSSGNGPILAVLSAKNSVLLYHPHALLAFVDAAVGSDEFSALSADSFESFAVFVYTVSRMASLVKHCLPGKKGDDIEKKVAFMNDQYKAVLKKDRPEVLWRYETVCGSGSVGAVSGSSAEVPPRAINVNAVVTFDDARAAVKTTVDTFSKEAVAFYKEVYVNEVCLGKARREKDCRNTVLPAICDVKPITYPATFQDDEHIFAQLKAAGEAVAVSHGTYTGMDWTRAAEDVAGALETLSSSTLKKKAMDSCVSGLVAALTTIYGIREGARVGSLAANVDRFVQRCMCVAGNPSSTRTVSFVLGDHRTCPKRIMVCKAAVYIARMMVSMARAAGIEEDFVGMYAAIEARKGFVNPPMEGMKARLVALFADCVAASPATEVVHVLAEESINCLVRDLLHLAQDDETRNEVVVNMAHLALAQCDALGPCGEVGRIISKAVERESHVRPCYKMSHLPKSGRQGRAVVIATLCYIAFVKNNAVEFCDELGHAIKFLQGMKKPPVASYILNQPYRFATVDAAHPPAKRATLHK
jgi:hypothetical protein